MEKLETKIFDHLRTIEENQEKSNEEIKAEAKQIAEATTEEVQDLKRTVETLKTRSETLQNLDTKVATALGNTVRKIAGVKTSDEAVTLETLQRDFIAIDPDTEAGSGGEEPELAGEKVYDAIIDVANEYGTLYPKAGKIKTGDRKFTFIKGDNLPLETGGFYKEGQEIALEKLKFTKDTVAIEDWYKIIAIADSTLADSKPEDMGAYIIATLGKAYAQLLDNEVAKSMKAVIQAHPVANYNAITFKDVLKVKGLLNSVYRKNGKFYLPFENYIELKTKTDNNGKPLFNITESADKLYLDGSEIVIADGLDTTDAFLYFGDLEETVAVIDRQSITIKKGENFLTNLQYFKGVARFKTTTKVLQAMAKLNKTT